MDRKKSGRLLLAGGVILLLFALVSLVLAQSRTGGPTISLTEEIIIKGEVQEPQTVTHPSREEPKFTPTSIDSVEKDYSQSSFALLSDLIAPAEEETKPKKMESLKSLLAKERY